MIFGNTAQPQSILPAKWLAALALLAPQAALAQDLASDTANLPTSEAATSEVAASTVAGAEAASGYTPLGPDMIKGQPEDAGLTFQTQYSEVGEQALWMHDAILLPLITIISLFVLFLLIWVMARYNRKANPTPSKTSHNTLIEIIWIGIPILILLGVSVPSIQLLLQLYESPSKDAVTVKVNGYQWYWGYEYTDNGGFEVLSNMLPEEDAIAQGLPPQLAVDNRMVVPVGEEIRIQAFGKDVIHAFAVPSLWFKIDAVPGRINERVLKIDEPGIYYGQCSELCGVRHGYMPIAVEAVPREQFDAWVLSQGGSPAETAAEGDTEDGAEDTDEAADGGEATEATAPADEEQQVEAAE